MSMLCNCCVRELLILARTWFAFGLPSKTGCDSSSVALLPALDRWAALAAMASASVGQPWRAWGSSPDPGSHRLRPRSALRHHALCSTSSTAAGWLGLGRAHRCPEPNVASGVHPLGAGHRCHLPHVVLGWYTPIPTPPSFFWHHCWQ
jgi:hypothetical protein